MSLHTLTVAELAAGLRGPALLEPRAHPALPRPHRAAGAGAQRLRHRHGRPGPRRCPARRRAAGEGRGRAADRRAHRPQGHLLHRRHPDDLRVADAVELRRALRRHGRRALAGGRHGAARQDQHGRVRHGLVERDQLLRPGQEPVGPEARAGRLLGRLGRGRGRLPRAGGQRHRHRRLDPPARGAHQPHRPQAHLRPRVALRDDRLRLEPRPGRNADALGRGRRAAARGHGRLRPARLDQRGRAGARITSPSSPRRSRACGSA